MEIVAELKRKYILEKAFSMVSDAFEAKCAAYQFALGLIPSGRRNREN